MGPTRSFSREGIVNLGFAVSRCSENPCAVWTKNDGKDGLVITRNRGDNFAGGGIPNACVVAISSACVKSFPSGLKWMDLMASVSLTGVPMG